MKDVSNGQVTEDDLPPAALAHFYIQILFATILSIVVLCTQADPSFWRKVGLDVEVEELDGMADFEEMRERALLGFENFGALMTS